MRSMWPRTQKGQQIKKEKRFKNERTRGWDKVRLWLPTGILEYNEEWDELAVPRYDFVEGEKGQMIALESKKNFKKRMRGKSPDVADGLVLTFQDTHEGGGRKKIRFI